MQQTTTYFTLSQTHTVLQYPQDINGDIATNRHGAFTIEESGKKWKKVREMRMHWSLTQSERWWTLLRVKYGDRWLPQRGLNRGCVQVRVVKGDGKGRKGVTAGEQGWTEMGNICAWNWRPGPVGRRDRSYGGKPWGDAFMQGAVFGVIKVVSRERYKLLFVLCCVFIAVVVKKQVYWWFWVINVVGVQIKQRVDIFITVFVHIALIFEVPHSYVSLHVNVFVWRYVAISESVNVSWWFRVSELQAASCVSGITVKWIIISDWIDSTVMRTEAVFCAVKIMPTDV